MLIGVYTGKQSIIDRDPKRAKELAAASFLQGHSLIVFEDSGVDVQGRAITGYQMINGAWEKVTTRPPDGLINPYYPGAKSMTDLEKIFRTNFPFCQESNWWQTTAI